MQTVTLLSLKATTLLRYCGLAIVAWVCVACASVSTPNPKDPFESYNRSMFKVNAAVDTVLTKPIAKGYVAVVPAPLRDCLGNAFDNLKVPFSAINNVLQGKLQAACEDVARFAINTTMGLGGCIDVATMVGIPHHKEDFGQTLAVWGVPSGPYVVLPILGSSNVRDAFATVGQLPLKSPVDRNMISKDIHHVPTRNSILGASVIQTRAELLPATNALEKMGVDEYAFVRDAAVRRRVSQVYDGNPPDDPSADVDSDVYSNNDVSINKNNETLPLDMSDATRIK
jgi:phospholipid-binding lipoprotein MlaA